MNVGGNITTEKWLEIYENLIIRQYLIDICKAFTRNKEFQEDLLQEAWIRIGACKPGMSADYYMNQGFRAMNNCYQKEWRKWRLMRNAKEYKRNELALRVRLHRARKKFKENVTKSLQTNK